MGRDQLRERLVLHAVAAAVTLLILAPLLRPGYVLRYDMVFVPLQPLRWDLIASGDALPRAVPQDAVVSLLSQVAPGWLLQRLALGAAIWLAAVGAARLVPAERRLTRVLAAVGYAWTPYLAERLLIGQWGLLLAYAALPWLVAAAIGVRAERRGALPRLVIAAAAAAITPTGGVLAMLTTVVLVAGRRVRRPRMSLAALAAVAALNAPWLTAAAATAAGGKSDPLGVVAFAARGENWGGPLVALAGTGGIWNALVTPPSRSSVFVPLVTAGLLALAVAGFPVLRRRWPEGVATRLAALAVGTFVLAAAGVLPGVAAGLRWLVAEVPGAGLLRDGQKLLIPYALCLVLCASIGAERLGARLPRPRDRIVLVGLILLPIVVLPDLALGAAGRLQPVRYPEDWRTIGRLVAAEPGPVLSLPLTMYRSYRWNNGTVTIDPMQRFLPAEVITDDTLIVGDFVVAGENARVQRIRALLAAGDPVAGSGVRWVVVQHDSRGDLPAGSLAGLQVVHKGTNLTLYRNPTAAPDERTVPARRWIALLGGLLAFVVFGAAIAALLRRLTAW